jgi:hypothetical protein
MSGVKVDMMNERKRRPFSWWVIALVILSLPLMVFSLVVLFEGEPKGPLVPTVDHWLAQLQRQDTALWKARRIAYEKLPEQAIDFLDIEDPEDPLSRQLEAIRRLREHPEAADRIVPLLVHWMTNTKDPDIVSSACETLAKFGPNAVSALPAVLTVISNHPPYGDFWAWQAALSIQPTNDTVRRLALDAINAAIQSSQTNRTPEAGFAVANIAWYLPATGISPDDIELLFDVVLDSGDVLMVDRFLASVRSKHYNDSLVERLLRRWNDQVPPEARARSLFPAIITAARRVRTHELALTWFQEALRHERYHPNLKAILINSIVRESDDNLRPKIVPELTDWLMTQPSGDNYDMGVIFEAHYLQAELRNQEAAREWFSQRVINSDNPHQIADWGRFWETYRDVTATLRQAVEILRATEHKKLAAVTTRLSRSDGAGFGGPVFQRHVHAQPGEQMVALLTTLRNTVAALDDQVPHKADAYKQLGALLEGLTLRASELPQP